MSSIVDTSLSNLPQPKTGWQLFKNLAFGEIAPGLAWEKTAYRRKFMLRSLATPLSTARLLSGLAKHPHLMQMLQVQPGLPCRLHRPWLTVNMDRQSALESLSWHYQMMCRQLPATLTKGYLSKQGVTLLTLTGKDEQQFTVRLCADAFMDKEGEATLVFCDSQNTALAEMTFTLCQFEGKSTLFIGGLQGAKAHVPHELIQGATKACHGLFPKRLLVEAAMTLGANPLSRVPATARGRTSSAAGSVPPPRHASPLPSPPQWLNPVLTNGEWLWRSPAACSSGHRPAPWQFGERRRRTPGDT